MFRKIFFNNKLYLFWARTLFLYVGKNEGNSSDTKLFIFFENKWPLAVGKKGNFWVLASLKDIWSVFTTLYFHRNLQLGPIS
jgi:hypothetical protein